MATQGGGGSHLATLTARRAGLIKSRERLMLSGSGGIGAPAAAQANVEAAAPVPPAPAATSAPAPPTDAGVPVRDPKMLEMAKQHLDSIRNQGNAVSPAPPPIQTAPPSVPKPLTQQIEQVGASGMSSYMQAYRLFGRTPGGREMVIFNATKTLETQLGRPPTRNEVLLHITSPGALTSGPEPVA